MCGRYTLRAKPESLAEAFDVPEVPELAGPVQHRPDPGCARRPARPRPGRREFRLLHWGLIPSWADDPAIGNRMINARAETVAEKPAFRHAFKAKRCLVLADGFYEWRREGGTEAALLHPHEGRPALRLRRAVGALGQGRASRSSPAPT